MDLVAAIHKLHIVWARHGIEKGGDGLIVGARCRRNRGGGRKEGEEEEKSGKPNCDED